MSVRAMCLWPCRWTFVLLIVLGAVGPAWGQTYDRSFSPQQFHVAPGPDTFVTVEPVAPLVHKTPAVGLMLDYARNPLSVWAYDSAASQTASTRANLIAHSVGAELWGAVGLIGRLQLALSIPMALYRTGQAFVDPEPLAAGGTTVPAASGFAFGDPRIYIKARFWGRTRGFQIGMSHWVSIPLGRDSDFGGEKHWTGFAGEPRVLLGWEESRWRIGASIGFAWRAHTSRFLSTVIGQQLTYAVAGAFDAIVDRLTLVLELFGHSGFDLDAGKVFFNDSPLEIALAAKVKAGHGINVTAGLSNGILAGLGSPQPRIFAGVAWVPDFRDSDRDRIPDSRDKCPDQPEDRDGFEDSDGCPDPDNDRDLIPDAKDGCPDVAEDYDEFQDEDGCPDLDNDGDGVPDESDRCPKLAEDGKGSRPSDGCPLSETDTDMDGVNDDVDKCPTEAEDEDEFQDEDGCPEIDNDEDGIPDEFDECKNEPETMNGFQDEDGCPDVAPGQEASPPPAEESSGKRSRKR